MRAAWQQVTVILGFNTQSEVFYEAEFRALGCRVIVTTADALALRCIPPQVLDRCSFTLRSDGRYQVEELARRLGVHAGADVRLAFTKIGNGFWAVRLK